MALALSDLSSFWQHLLLLPFVHHCQLLPHQCQLLPENPHLHVHTYQRVHSAVSSVSRGSLQGELRGSISPPVVPRS